MGENCKALLQKFQLKKIFSEWKTDFSELRMHHGIHPGDPGRTALETLRTVILLLIAKSL